MKLGFVSLGATLVTACAGRPPPAAPTADRFEPLLAAAHAAGRFDGLAVVVRDGRVLHRSARGLADRAGAPHAVDEPFPLASITKQLTAVLVMQEVEAGRLALDAPITDVLPELAPAMTAVTTRDLLRHTAGLRDPEVDLDATGVPRRTASWSRCSRTPTAPTSRVCGAAPVSPTISSRRLCAERARPNVSLQLARFRSGK